MSKAPQRHGQKLGQRFGLGGSRRSLLLFAVTTSLCVLSYLWQLGFGEVRPGNAWGVGWGIAAALLCLGVALYGARRRMMRGVSRRRLGSARAWLDFHLYGGLLFALLLLMHSAFRLPTGALNLWLWGLSLWTVLSGLLGVLLQRWIPKVLSSGLWTEINYQRIPELTEDIRRQAEALAAVASGPVRQLYKRQVANALSQPQRRLAYFVDITGGLNSKLKEFEYLARFLAGEERQRLAELEHLYRAKLEIDAHYTLQPALRAWLYLHVPISLAVLALIVLHIVVVVLY